MAVSDNILGYYRFNTDSTDPVNGNNGTDTNSPTYTTGLVGNALTLVASSSQYVSLPQAVIPYGTNTLTINLLVKFASTTATTRALVMTGRTGQGVNIYYDGSSMRFDKPNVVSLGYAWTIDTSWHMWTFESDGSGMRIYKDGNSTPVASNANTSNWVAPSTDLTTIGAYRLNNTLQAGWYFDGQIDMSVFYSDAKSTTDISTLWNSGAGNDFLLALTMTMTYVSFSLSGFAAAITLGTNRVLSLAHTAFSYTGYTLSFILDLYTRVTNRAKHATTVTNRNKTASASVTNKVKHSTTVTNRPKS